jgi:hypothetical protein
MYIINMDRCNYPNPVSFVCEEANGLQRGLLLEIVGKAENGIWLDGEDNEAFKVQLAPEGAVRGNLVIHTSVCLQYDERLDERDFVLAKGQVGRAHELNKGDEYTLPVDMVAGVDAIGDELVLAGNGKLKVGTGNVVAVVTKIYNFNGQESVRIRIM